MGGGTPGSETMIGTVVWLGDGPDEETACFDSPHDVSDNIASAATRAAGNVSVEFTASESPTLTDTAIKTSLSKSALDTGMSRPDDDGGERRWACWTRTTRSNYWPIW